LVPVYATGTDVSASGLGEFGVWGLGSVAYATG